MGGLKLNLGGSKASPLKPASSTPTPAAPIPSPVAVAEGPVDSLAALAADESAGLLNSDELTSLSGYHDEIPATAPERELPADMTPQMTAFVESLNNIYMVLDDPELFAQMIRSMMMEMQENPELAKLLADDDIACMIRGMRESMGMARLKKEEAKTKKTRSTSSSKKAATASNEIVDDLAALAKSMGMDFG